MQKLSGWALIRHNKPDLTWESLRCLFPGWHVSRDDRFCQTAFLLLLNIYTQETLNSLGHSLQHYIGRGRTYLPSSHPLTLTSSPSNPHFLTLRSRCTMLSAWRCCTPSTIWYTTSRAFSSGSGSIAITRNNSPPVALNKHKNGLNIKQNFYTTKIFTVYISWQVLQEITNSFLSSCVHSVYSIKRQTSTCKHTRRDFMK